MVWLRDAVGHKTKTGGGVVVRRVNEPRSPTHRLCRGWVVHIIKVNKFNDAVKNTLDEWVYFLKNSEVKDEFKAKGLAEAKEVLDIMRLNAKAQYGYNRHIEALHLKASEALSLRIQQEELMEQKIEEAKVEIRKRVLNEGIEQGIEQGIAQEKLNMAKMMLANGEIDEKISQYTGLTHEQIQQLKNDNSL